MRPANCWWRCTSRCKTYSDEVPAAQPHVLKVTQLLDQIEFQLRRLSHELMPALLSDLGLVPALRYLFEGLAQRSQLQISIDAVPEQRLPRRVETTLYHVAKEALTTWSSTPRRLRWESISPHRRFDTVTYATTAGDLTQRRSPFATPNKASA